MGIYRYPPVTTMRGGQPRKVRSEAEECIRHWHSEEFYSRDMDWGGLEAGMQLSQFIILNQNKSKLGTTKIGEDHIIWGDLTGDLTGDASPGSSPGTRPGSPSSSPWAWRPGMTSRRPRADQGRGQRSGRRPDFRQMRLPPQWCPPRPSDRSWARWFLLSPYPAPTTTPRLYPKLWWHSWKKRIHLVILLRSTHMIKSYLQTSLSFCPHLSRSSVPARSSASVSFTTRMSTFSRMSRP